MELILWEVPIRIHVSLPIFICRAGALASSGGMRSDKKVTCCSLLTIDALTFKMDRAVKGKTQRWWEIGRVLHNASGEEFVAFAMSIKGKDSNEDEVEPQNLCGLFLPKFRLVYGMRLSYPLKSRSHNI